MTILLVLAGCTSATPVPAVGQPLLVQTFAEQQTVCADCPLLRRPERLEDGRLALAYVREGLAVAQVNDSEHPGLQQLTVVGDRLFGSRDGQFVSSIGADEAALEHDVVFGCGEAVICTDRGRETWPSDGIYDEPWALDGEELPVYGRDTADGPLVWSGDVPVFRGAPAIEEVAVLRDAHAVTVAEDAFVAVAGDVVSVVDMVPPHTTTTVDVPGARHAVLGSFVDGNAVLFVQRDDGAGLYPLDGGAPTPMASLEEDAVPEVAADVNGDGLDDLVVVDGDRVLALLGPVGLPSFGSE